MSDPLDLFPNRPHIRRPRRVLMRVTDAGFEATRWRCRVCGWEDWIRHATPDKGPSVKHREPCPVCNQE